MKTSRLSIPVNFDLSFLKIRWSDHIFVKDKSKIAGEGVVYGGNWEKAERLARQMAEMKFGASRRNLKVCEQIFIPGNNEQKTMSNEARGIQKRKSNLKVKVGRNVFEDVKTLEYIKNELKFPNKIRIDANQGYSIEQLTYLLPTLRKLGIEYVEEPVKVKDLQKAIHVLHQHGLKIILDESLNVLPFIVIPESPARRYPESTRMVDAINIKFSRTGDINKAIDLIKQCKKHHKKVIIGCSEELERGMKAIYALGHIAQQEEVLLEVEGFGPLRLAQKYQKVPRLYNRAENIFLITQHRLKQFAFTLWWHICRYVVLSIKKTKVLSALSLHIVKATGKSRLLIHPKHLLGEKFASPFLKYLKKSDMILDVGCGNGCQSIAVAKLVAHVSGFDIGKEQLSIARSNASNMNITNIDFQLYSAEKKFPLDHVSFDKVLCLGVLEHLHHREKVLREIYRVLKKEGTLFLGVPQRGTSWKNTQERFGICSFTDPDHKVEYTREGWSNLLRSTGFEVAAWYPVAYDTPWAGFIDLVGGFSLSLYRRFIQWKWTAAKKNPNESISVLIVAKKK